MKKIFSIVVCALVVLSFFNINIGASEQTSLLDGLTYYYSFDDSSNVGKDDSGNGNDLIELDDIGGGNENKISDVFGNYASFDGFMNYAQVPDGIFETNNKDITISFWVYVKEFIDFTRFFDFGAGDMYFAAIAYPMSVEGSENDGRIEAVITRTGWIGSDFSSAYNDAATMKSNTWQHITVTIKDMNMTVYVDGVEAASCENKFEVGEIEESEQNYLGKSRYGQDPILNGYMDDFRIYSRALSTDEIAELASGKAPKPEINVPDPTQTATPADTPTQPQTEKTPAQTTEAATQTTMQANEPSSEDSSSIVIYIVLAVIAAAVIGGIVFIVMKRKKQV